LITVFGFIHIAALKKEFQAGIKFTITYQLLHDAMLIIIIFFIRLINTAPPERSEKTPTLIKIIRMIPNYIQWLLNHPMKSRNGLFNEKKKFYMFLLYKESILP
jgi:hypothetical protein